MARTKANFTPHMMYKGKMSKRAKTYEEHMKLKKMGYSHTKPKAKKTMKKTMKKKPMNKGLKMLPKKVQKRMGY